jgi:putative sigma-54 modulation protein
MKITFTGKHMEVENDVKKWAEKKFAKLDKFFRRDSETQITVSDKKRGKYKVDATITHKGILFRAEIENKDLYTGIDKAVEVIERQIRKNKTRLERKLHEGAFDAYKDSEPVAEEGEFKIVKSKRFVMKPMSVDEAILQMNLIGHEFYVFVNDANDRVSVAYKRKDGNYGLIETEQ